jgi:hypothetical protein
VPPALTVGLDVADALIGLAITLVILRTTWQSWRTVNGRHPHCSAQGGFNRLAEGVVAERTFEAGGHPAVHADREEPGLGFEA